ncbi:MAG: hypothetical protein JO039_06355 [Solirubrobacterales bacterium]|nr:hypothetical protein [Solirubrobacterales bacterium]
MAPQIHGGDLLALVPQLARDRMAGVVVACFLLGGELAGGGAAARRAPSAPGNADCAMMLAA